MVNSSLSAAITVSLPHSLAVSDRLTTLPTHLLPLRPHLLLGLLFFMSTSRLSVTHIHKLLTSIWKVSGRTTTVLIRTSWYILAGTCTYGNSIRTGGEGVCVSVWKGGGGKRGKERVVECVMGR